MRKYLLISFTNDMLLGVFGDFVLVIIGVQIHYL